MTLGERVKAEREAKKPKKWSQAELARRVSLLLRRKITQVAIHHIEARGDVNPGFVVELAQALGVTYQWLRTGRGAKYVSQEGREDMQRSVGSRHGHDINVPISNEMRKDVPIYGTVSGLRGGWQEMANGEAVDWARRPPRLEGRSDVFGLYVEDLAMTPAYRPGSLILVEQIKPPDVHDDVVIEHLEAKDDPRTILRRLVDLSTTAIKVEQYNPAKVYEIPRKQIVRMYRVMTMADLLGS